ncbi:MAG: family 78 glycoside hydrolase catalytic domain [Planctomycetia bacterium]|nr:family 78 glycoside hydrolase catalytic domain [Planctomycetia bacterium]
MKRRDFLYGSAAGVAGFLASGSPETRADGPTVSTTETGSERCSIRPANLQCEYLTDPCGMDVAQPRFSWTLEATDPTQYAQRQTAYRIEVIRNQESSDTVVWDSTWVESDQMSQIVYMGTSLESDTRYRWTVRVRDEEGEESATIHGTFITGVFDPAQWKAQWIGSDQLFDGRNIGIPKGDNNIDDPWLRKTFELTEAPDPRSPSLIHVASIGYHELYVNGEKVDDTVLSPCVSNHTRRARYVTYDISEFLKKGTNVVALWLGTSWSIFGPYITEGTGGAESANLPRTPIVLAQAVIRLEGIAEPMVLITDGTWKVMASYSKLLGSWDFGSFAGELIDETRRNPDWNRVDSDDSSWATATVYEPCVELSAQMCEPNRVLDEVRPVKIERREDGSYRVDMGVNFAGWMEMKVHGEPGGRVDFLFSEREQDEMTFRIYSAIQPGPEGTGVFRNRFNYHSGRWITIRGLTKEPELTDFRGWLVRTDYKDATRFECSDDLQSWINDRVRWTYENLSIGGYIVDCPQRERLGYGGDAHATSETGLFQYQLGAFYTKWMEDWRDVQGRDSIQNNMNDPAARNVPCGGVYLNNGVLPHSAPTYSGGGGPAWGGIVVTLPWSMYLHYGDTRILGENFEMITKWLAFLDTHTESGILQRFGAVWDYLADWLWPGATAEGMNNDKIQAVCFNSCYRVFNLETASKIATVLGRTDEASKWRAQADEARRAIHEKFFDEKDLTYCDGSMSCLAAALLAYVPPAELRPQIMDRLERMIVVDHKGHIDAGITGGAMIFRLLREEQRSDLLLMMTSQTDYPGWGHMRAHGATTIWEMWEPDLAGHSLLHSSYLYPGAWYVDGIAGIQRDESQPGFRHFVVRPPKLPEGSLTSAGADFDSPSGRIQVAWKLVNGRCELDVVIPPNTSATVYVPGDGRKCRNVAQMNSVGEKAGYTLFELPAGHWVF